MNDDHQLTNEQNKRLRHSIQTIELTGNQLAIVANALAFNLVHLECMMSKNKYSDIYYKEVNRLQTYISSYVLDIIRENDDSQKKNGPNGQPPKPVK